MTTNILMCSPTYFINADNKSAVEGWNNLKNTITRFGAKVLVMEPKSGQPDIVFAANSALIYKDNAVISKFKSTEKDTLEKIYENWFEKQDFNIESLPEGMHFEGTADALFSEQTLYSGYTTRRDIASHTYISYLLNLRVISLELIDHRFSHLNTCFCPLSDGHLMYYPQAFDKYANKIIEKDFALEKRIIVTEEEALGFACNAVNLDKSVILNHTTDRLKNELQEKGFDVYEVDLSEFIKAGGSAKSLILKID